MSSDRQRFTRASATGNTFIIADGAIDGDRSEMAQKICRGFIGFHSDGFIVLDKFNGDTVAWDFYNADGSSAEMCGNGTRCVAEFFLKHKNKKELTIQTIAGDIKTKALQPGLIQTQMPPVQECIDKEVLLSGKKIKGVFVNSGVPHFVIKTIPNKALAEKLRSHKDFGKNGANITFIEEVRKSEIRAVSFERGVEDFTLSCGTGAVAAAIAHLKQQKSKKTCSVEMPGGNLQVDWVSNENITLTGPAQLEFSFRVET